jgi:cytochrome bd ubiquinol oxidase subunit I
LGLVALSWWLRWRGDLYDTRWFLNACMLASPLGFVAVIAGWFATDVGRQPWVVYGLMRTRDAVTPSLTGRDVLISLIIYVLAYIFVYGGGVVLLARLVRTGPGVEPEEPAKSSRRPLSVVEEATEEGAR